MKHFVDVQVVLATAQDMEDWEDQAEQAADRMNLLLHMLYDKADQDIQVQSLENMLQYIWENWHRDPHLLEIDEIDLHDWVDHLLATWDDGNLHQ